MAAAAPVISAIAGSTAAKVGAGVVGGTLLARQLAPKPPAAPAVAPVAPVTPVAAVPTPVPPAAPTPPAPITAPAAEVKPAAPAAETKPAATTPAPAPAPAPAPTVGQTSAASGQMEEAAVKAVSAGAAEDKAAETAARGRRSTIATGPQGILGASGTRQRRSLVGGGLIR